jgi:MFS family permease
MLKSPLLPIFLIVVVDVFALTLMIPLLPFYAERFGATPLQVGALASGFALCQLIAGPFLGALSDRFGRRPVLLVSQLGTFAGFVLLARATSLWMVFAARMIDGATAGNLSVAQAYIADVTPPDRRARAFGLIGVAFGVGFFLGPWVSGALSQRDVRLPVWAAAALSALSILATLTLLPGHRPPAREEAGAQGRRLGLLSFGRYRELVARPALTAVFAQFFLFQFAFSLFSQGFALFAERRFVTDAGAHWGPREVGRLFAYAGFLGIILQGGAIGRLVARFGERRVANSGFAAFALGYSLLAAARDLPGVLLATTVSAYGGGAPRPALTSLVSQRAEGHEQGLALGCTQSLASVAQVLAPMLGGALIDHGWLTAWALTPAAVAVVALAVRVPAAPTDRGGDGARADAASAG